MFCNWTLRARKFFFGLFAIPYWEVVGAYSEDFDNWLLEKVKDDNCHFLLDKDRHSIIVDGEELYFWKTYDMDMFRPKTKMIRASRYTVYLARKKLLKAGTKGPDEIKANLPRAWKPAKKGKGFLWKRQQHGKEFLRTTSQILWRHLRVPEQQ